MLAPMERHALNKSFVWQQPDPPYELITQAQADAYREDGVFVVEDAFDAREIAELIAELDAIEAGANAALAEAPNGAPTISRKDEIVFQAHLVVHNEVARRFAQHPVFVGLCHDLIGPGARLYWDQLVYKHPGTAAEFPWHQDNGYTYVEPQQYLTCWVALTAADEANGCPWIVPGMHLGGTLRHRWTELGFECDTRGAQGRPLTLSAGSVAVFSSLTPHRTGPNLTDAIRKAYILQYAPDGAVVYPRQGEPASADDPQRQFLME